MIEIYDYRDLDTKLCVIPVMSGTERREINAAYSLRAEIWPRSLKEKGIAITPFTVFRVDGVFYRQKVFQTADGETGVVKIDASDLLSSDLIGLDVESFDMAGTAYQMLGALLTGTKFRPGVCDSTGVQVLELKNTNKQAVLNKILELFGAELDIDGLTVCIKNRIERYVDGVPFRLIKGENGLIIEENTDISGVITQLRYLDSTIKPGQDEDGNAIPVISSMITGGHASEYPPSEVYKEFRGGADEQAARYLAANEQPRVSYKVTVPFNFRPRLELGTVTQVLSEALDIDVTLRVISVTRDLTGKTGDIYTIGNREKHFLELILDETDGGVSEEQLDEIQERIEEDVLSNLELIIPEIIDEKFQELDFPDISEILADEELVGGIAGLVITDTEFIDGLAQLVDDRLTVSIGDGGHIVLDRLPTREEADALAEGAVVLVYDKSAPLFPA